jgi:hypothetical protein
MPVINRMSEQHIETSRAPHKLRNIIQLQNVLRGEQVLQLSCRSRVLLLYLRSYHDPELDRSASRQARI